MVVKIDIVVRDTAAVNISVFLIRLSLCIIS